MIWLWNCFFLEYYVVILRFGDWCVYELVDNQLQKGVNF